MNNAQLIRMLVLFFMLIGVGLFSGFAFPCFNGPFNILKLLRDKIGKPFSCPICALTWGIIIPAMVSFWVPLFFYMIAGSIGWGLLIMHVTGYMVIFEGMEMEEAE